MAIEVVVCYVVTCDKCEDTFEGDYIPHFHNLIEAREHVETFGGAVWGDHVRCEDCIPPCTCGHSLLEHDHGDAPCDECACEGYDPQPEEVLP